MPSPDLGVTDLQTNLFDKITSLGLVPLVATPFTSAESLQILFNQLLARCSGLTMGTIVNSDAIANQAAETAFTPAGTQQFAFPAGALNGAGRIITFKAEGTMACTGTPTMLMHARLGGVAGDIVGLSSALTLSNNSTAAAWKFEGGFTVRTTGAAANLRAGAAEFKIVNAAAGAGAALVSLGNGPIADVVADLTAALALVITVDWSAADAANTITMTRLEVTVNN